MIASDLKLEELIEFSEGSLDFQGRRLILYSLNAFAQFRRDLTEMVGPVQTRRILTRFGYFMGQADAAAMSRVFRWDSLEEWIKAGPRLHTLMGVARDVIKSFKLDRSGAFEMELVWHNSGEAEEHLKEIGRVDFPICWMQTGYASGYVSYCLGKNVYFIEQKCRACGARTCIALGKDEASWGDEIKPHLSFFQSHDIQGKIRELTTDLRRTTRELLRHQKRIALLERNIPPFFFEIRSRAFLQVVEIAKRVAPYDSSILITGESGTGKEILTRYIHSLSLRASEPFVGVNCGGLTETLLESELFGHKKGSFTGAIENRIGLFEQANQGTIFLDEIGDVSPALQLKLLRVLQEREIMRVGESKPRKIDVRVIAATNKNLKEEIESGRFREDLYYRLGVIEIEIPPLRNRQQDIISLSRYFVKKYSEKMKLPHLRLDASCLDYLLHYNWPGNVRELENTIERAAVLSDGGMILPRHLPGAILQTAGTEMMLEKPQGKTLADIESQYIKKVLQSVNGNRTHAAKILDISSATLWRKLKQMGEPAEMESVN